MNINPCQWKSSSRVVIMPHSLIHIKLMTMQPRIKARISRFPAELKIITTLTIITISKHTIKTTNLEIHRTMRKIETTIMVMTDTTNTKGDQEAEVDIEARAKAKVEIEKKAEAIAEVEIERIEGEVRHQVIL